MFKNFLSMIVMFLCLVLYKPLAKPDAKAKALSLAHQLAFSSIKGD